MEGFSEDPGPQGSSIAAPLIRALLAAALAFGVYWLVFAQADPADDVAALVTETVPAATVPPEPLTPTTPPVLDSTPMPTFTPAPEQVGAGVTVQVLNGTDDQALMDSVVATLRELGYDVTLSGRARNDYSATTIFATAGQETAAEALQTTDPRFTTIGENPGNLSTELDIHVVVGEDWEASQDASGADATPAPTATDG